MTLSSIGKDIFIGDSAATNHMTNNRTGVYDLIPIRGLVMIGNGESISSTHKGKLDVICKHKDGSTARQTWEVNDTILPVVSLFSLRSNNSTTRTLQYQCNNQTGKPSGAWTILLPLLQELNSLEVLVF